MVNEPFIIKNEWGELEPWLFGGSPPSEYRGWYSRWKHFPEASLFSPDINIVGHQSIVGTQVSAWLVRKPG